MRPHLDTITLRGFKTIRELKDFAPGSLTVLIGPNGAGKSNFISFFRLLSWALAPPGQLQEHVAKLGGASALLHDGPERSPYIEAELKLVMDAGDNEYFFRRVRCGRYIRALSTVIPIQQRGRDINPFAAIERPFGDQKNIPGDRQKR